MKHYICKGGCEGVSQVPGTCQAEKCPRRGTPLEECSCKDGTHFGAFQKKEGRQSEDMDMEQNS